MDIQSQLQNVISSIRDNNLPHARRLLRQVKSLVEDNRVVYSLVLGAINDTHITPKKAMDDAKTAKLVDARSDYSMML